MHTLHFLSTTVKDARTLRFKFDNEGIDPAGMRRLCCKDVALGLGAGDQAVCCKDVAGAAPEPCLSRRGLYLLRIGDV
jgi:hypothetical protein